MESPFLQTLIWFLAIIGACSCFISTWFMLIVIKRTVQVIKMEKEKKRILEEMKNAR